MKRNPSRISSTTVLVNDELATRTGEDFYAGVPVLGLKENALKIQAATAAPNHYATPLNRSVLVPAVPEAFTYDADGNLLQDGLWSYEWDAENRLVAQELRSDVAASTWKRMEYGYDKEGRRVRKLVKTRTTVGGTWTTASDIRFLYDGWNLLAEYSYVSSTFTLLRSHAWGLDLSGSAQGAGGVGGLLWTTVASTAKTYAAAADANGNIIAYMDVADGSIAGKRDYGSFGEAVITTGVAGSLPFGFSTKYEEKESGLYYYGFRYYNPSTGRWPSRDPIAERGGLNLYAFINNNPIGKVDYLGLALTPYSGSVTPQWGQTGAASGDTLSGWPEQVATASGDAVVIKGELSPSITIDSLLGADVVNGERVMRPDIVEHEMGHFKRTVAAWNAQQGAINFWEAKYCPSSCAEIAARIANLKNVINKDRHLQGEYQGDYDERGFPGYKIQAEAAAERVKDNTYLYDKALEEYHKMRCFRIAPKGP